MTIIVDDIITGVNGILGKFIADEDTRIEAATEVQKVADAARAREDQLLQGQIDINKIEAQSPKLFVSGWRPFIGWSCGGVMIWVYVLAPLIKELANMKDLPTVDPSQFTQILLAILGIGGTLHTVEKIKGVAYPGQNAPIVQAPSAQPPQGVLGKIGSWFK